MVRLSSERVILSWSAYHPQTERVILSDSEGTGVTLIIQVLHCVQHDTLGLCWGVLHRQKQHTILSRSAYHPRPNV
ncbi:MAG: hypothetical protein KA165_04070, partial [Saprospiraceae bacterium]|nr:hypothetical protein [Saprospiraceae bacterium]